MTVVKVIELLGISEKSFEDAIETAIKKANKSLKHIHGADIIGQKVKVNDKGKIVEYRVDMKVAFKLD
ncbi:MAG: dodecin family protein [Candidatus Micrarchaeota archaeon]